MALISISNKEDFDEIINRVELSVIHFYAEWADQCKHMNDVMLELTKTPNLKKVQFAKLAAEDFPEISLEYNITAVPTFVFVQEGKQIDRLEGANAPELFNKVTLRAKVVTNLFPTIVAKSDEDLEKHLKGLIKTAPVMLFMKGTLQEPKCGFSRQLVQLLNEQGVSYKTYNILQDQQVREGLKKFSNWPTYPQLYIEGELVGGIDIVRELIASGEFKIMLKKSLEDRLKSLINQQDIMLFMKGCPDSPKCGFSKQIVEILNSTKLKYGTFDILEDEDVRQGLKEFSNWPTYPQLYVKGELFGGLDIVKELQQTGELLDMLKPSS